MYTQLVELETRMENGKYYTLAGNRMEQPFNSSVVLQTLTTPETQINKQ